MSLVPVVTRADQMKDWVVQRNSAVTDSTFRADINGLRAIAVIVVVLFHMGQPDWPGGFVGVDVFFVISGYLIIPRVYSEILNGEFSWRSFLEKRIRRLVPALLPVLVYALIVGALMFGPHSFEELLNSVAAAAGFVSNYLFTFTRGYFETSTDRMLLLHTWSLGVEFQFYLLLPIILVTFRKSFPRALTCFIVMSFALSVFWTQSESNNAYYDVISRFWQLGIGGLAGLLQLKGLRTFPSKLVWIARPIGMSLIFYCAVTFSDNNPYPGLYALVPTIGAIMVVVAPETKRDPLLYLLKSRPLGWLGLRSYSIYLWHWPLILTGTFGFGEPSDEKLTAAVLISFVVAELSYRYLEKPVQKNHWWKATKPTVTLIVIPIITFFGIATLNQSSSWLSKLRNDLPMKETRLINGIADPARHAYLKKLSDFGTRGENGLCSLDKLEFLPDAINCLARVESRASTLFIGDSHGRDYFWVFQSAFPEHSMHMLHQSGCAPAEYGKCFKGLISELPTLLEAGQYQDVVLISFWPLAANKGVENTLDILAASDVDVHIVGASPVFADDIAQIIFPKGERLAVEAPLREIWGNFRLDPFKAESELLNLSSKYQTTFVDRLSLLCPEQKCLSFVPMSDDLMYFDDQHLTLKGIEYVASRFRMRSELKSIFN